MAVDNEVENNIIKELIADSSDEECTCQRLEILKPCKEYDTAFAFRVQNCNFPGHPETNTSRIVQGELRRLKLLKDEEEDSFSTEDEENENDSFSTEDEENENESFSTEDDEEHEDEEEDYCFCGCPSHGKMIACDGKNCSYEWFHIACVGMVDDMFLGNDIGEWFCPCCEKERITKHYF